MRNKPTFEDRLVEIARELATNYPDKTFLLLGVDPDAEALHQSAQGNLALLVTAILEFVVSYPQLIAVMAKVVEKLEEEGVLH